MYNVIIEYAARNAAAAHHGVHGVDRFGMEVPIGDPLGDPESIL